MALEIAVQVTLVGEVELVHKFLEALVSVYEVHLKLNDCKVVDYLLCILSAGTLANGVKVSCGDSHLVGIELHRPLLAEVVGEQYAELVKEFVLVFAYVFLCWYVVRLTYVLYVEQQRVYCQDDILATIVHICRVAAGLNVKNVYLAENVVQELFLEVAVATLVCATFEGLYCFGAN